MCQSNFSGGLYASIRTGAQLIFEGDCQFKDCSVNGFGGGINAWCDNEGSLIRSLGELLFDNCSSTYAGGGALCDATNNASIELNKVTCNYCISDQGAGLQFQSGSNTNLSISGQASFTRCESSFFGGGIYFNIPGDNAEIQLTGEMQFIDCIGYNGGGMIIQSFYKFILVISSSCTFQNCSSGSYGGGIFISSSNNDTDIQISGQLSFDNCTSYYGGGLFLEIINSSISFENIIQFKDCSCQYDGGGINDGGGIYASCSNQGMIKFIGELNFDNCSTDGRGGGGEFYTYNQGQIVTNNITCNDCKAYEGGGLYIYSQDENSIIEFSGIMTFVDCIGQIGGGLYIRIQQSGQILISNRCTLTRCIAEQSGGGIYIYSQDQGNRVIISGNLSFELCQSQGSGGGLFVSNSNGSIISLIGQCKLTSCTAQNSGGGISVWIIGENSKFIIGDGIVFDTCSSYDDGGGIYVYIRTGAQLIFEGDCKFKDCSSVNGSGGGLEVRCNLEGSLIRSLGELLFDNCSSSSIGGGAYFRTSNNDNSTIELNKLICIDCTSYDGGGLSIQFGSSTVLTLSGQASFTRCESIGNGGGISFSTLEENVEIRLTRVMNFVDCVGYSGGGIFIQSFYKMILDISNSCTLLNCSSILGNGGGIYSNIIDGSLNIEDTTFDRCTCTQPGNGGGIALIPGTSSIISITNSSFINCETISNSSNQRYGWGGAIFIQTQIAAENLNQTNFLIRDLVFNGCSAVNSIGNNIHIQSIDTYATGEAIENGNLLTVNDTIDLYYNNSYLYDYMGIDESKVEDGTTIDNNIPLFSFHALKTCISDNNPKGCTPLCTIDSNSTIEQQDSCFCNQDSHPTNCRCPVDSSQLEGIPTEVCQCIDVDDSRDKNLCKFQLKKVELIVNTSKANPLRFNFYGERFTQENIYAKIVELQNKTQEEIKYEKDNNKQYQDKYNTKKSNQTYTGNYSQNHNSNTIKQYRMFESLASSKYLNPLYHNYPNIISNQEVLPRDEDGYIIWPPENATELPLFIDNVYIESKQKASFQMNDASWLDSRKKWYGMLISADNEKFVGKDGNKDEAIRIDVFVEEGEQFVNFNKNQTSEPLDDSDETDSGKSGRFQFPI
ncbi:MAG: hypothetical protein EZS28_029899, partial [Streblomastix strix]